MKTFYAIFLTVGFGLLAGASYSYTSTTSFIKTSSTVTGSVLENRYERSGSDNSGSYYSYVKFNTIEGKEIVFRTSVGTNPPSYNVGEVVRVLYDPKQPENATVDSFMQLWFLSVLLGGLGALFSGIPLLMILFGLRTKRRGEWLRVNGDRISAQFTGVIYDSSVRVNGKSPYIVTAKWTNPRNNQLHQFQSSRVWFDPEPFIKDKNLQIFIDRNDASKYHVDLSFLPQSHA